MRSLQEDNEALRADNEQLRSLINERSMAKGPLRGEQFYASEFRELFTLIDTWVVTIDRPTGGSEGTQPTDLATDRADKIVKGLRESGTRGSASATFLQTNGALFQRAYRSPRSRVELERHVIAAILFDQVFAPLVFGIPADWAEMLRSLVDVIERDGMRKQLCN
jgi:hypothetical protein